MTDALFLSRKDAAKLLGISSRTFRRVVHVEPVLVKGRGTKRAIQLYPKDELDAVAERWKARRSA